MILLKSIHGLHLRALLELQSPSICRKNPILTSSISPYSSNILFFHSMSRRPFSIWSLFWKKSEEKTEKITEPLSAVFKRTVELNEKAEVSDVEAEDSSENVDLKEKLRNLEIEVRSLNKERSENAKSLELLSEKCDLIVEKGRKRNDLIVEKGDKRSDLIVEKGRKRSGLIVEKPNKRSNLIVEKGHKRRSLSALFGGKSDSIVENGCKESSLSALFGVKERKEVKQFKIVDKRRKEVKLFKPVDFGNEDPAVHKELSDDMQMFARHLYMQGYLQDVTFMPKNRFDLNCFEVSYAREFLKFAAVKFGEDHPGIAKWLSASDLKKVALFGCPSLGQRTIHAAKHMRNFFGIEEREVCRMCTLRKSCKHANKKSRINSSQLQLASVTRVLTMYAMESVPEQLTVPKEITNSVSRLLKEVINLSQTPP